MAASRAGLAALLTHATAVPAPERAALAEHLRADLPRGAILVETCHRTELYVADRGLLPDSPNAPKGSRFADGPDVAEHVIGLAVGLRSTVVAEDQILHQLRTSVEAARERGRLEPELDRLFDLALRAGRRARSWLPARRRPSLADVALDLVADRPMPAGSPVLVVGAGEMGRLATSAVFTRRGRPMIASRTPARAEALASQVGADAVAFDPGADLVGTVTGVVIALRGTWRVASETRDAIADGDSWIVDLSSPPAIPEDLRGRLGSRLVTIDDLARVSGPEREHHLVQRLTRLASDTAADYAEWLDREPRRETARAMAERAAIARAAELDRLWERLPSLGPTEREEIERMARHLAERLLREPLERLGRDADGRHAEAARELFGL